MEGGTGSARANTTSARTVRAKTTSARTVRATAAHQRPARPLDPVRRPEILAAAVELLREQGLWSVRVADVAVRAGTSAAGVIYYFGTKQQLFEAAIAGADAAFYSALRPELDVIEDPVARLARLVVRSSASDWVLWMDLWAYARRHPPLLRAAHAFHARWRETIAAVIRHGVERTAFRSSDVEGTAERLAAITDGLAIQMVLDGGRRSRENYVRHALRAAAAELGCDPRALERVAADA